MQKLNCLREFTDRQDVTPLFENVLDDNGNIKGRNLYIKGPFLQGDVINRNGRIYPVQMLEGSISTFKKEKMRGIGVPGELNHPESSIQIDLDRVSHYITELDMQGKDGIGKAKIASTPKGQIAQALMDDGMILGVSTRGVGRLGEDEQGRKIVSDFELITVDIVSDPSAPNAFVQAVMEGLQYYVDGNNDIQLATRVDELLESMKHNLSSMPLKSESRSEKIYSLIDQTLSKLV
jgi:hypothetical protein